MPAWAEEIQRFVGIDRPHPTFETVLSTVLFTDIVGSTERQTAVGDRAWRGGSSSDIMRSFAGP